MPAEVTLHDPAVICTVEQGAPGFQFADPVGRFLRVQFRHAPVVQILAAPHRIGKVDLPVIAVVHVRQRRGHAAFRHHGVSFAEQALTNHTHLNARTGRLNGSPKPRAARADYQNVIGMRPIFGH